MSKGGISVVIVSLDSGVGGIGGSAGSVGVVDNI